MGEQQAFTFGPYRLEAPARRLLRHGEPVTLTPKAFDVLLALVERRDRVVEKAELMQLVWPDSYVEEANLSQTIYVLRQILGDAADGRPYIDTVPRRGYRFAAGAPPENEEIGRRLKPAATSAAATLAAPWAAAALVAAAVLAVSGTALMRSWSSPPGRLESLVVLPFGNLSKDAGTETLADSLTDALTTKLGQIAGLRVISRTSAVTYRNTDKTVPQIGRELNVDAIVEGTVERDGERVRLNLKLIHAPADRTVWAQSYEQDAETALDLHNQMARAIVSRTSVALTDAERGRLAGTTRVNPRVYEAYLKGRYFWARRTEPDMRQAIANFEEAIRLDSSYAPAYAGLADSYALYGSYGWKLPGGHSWGRAVAAAELSIALDPDLADGHTSRARIALNHEMDWARTGAGYRRALELNPGYANARHWYGYYLLLTGDLDGGEREIRRALQLDPLSPIFNANAGMAFYFGRRFDEAAAHWRNALEMHRNYPLLHSYLATAYAGKGMYPEAVAQLEKGMALSNDSRDLGLLAHIYGRMGRVTDARALVAKMLAEGNQAAYDIAVAYVGMGDVDEAFTWLARSVDTRMGAFNELHAEPMFDAVRADPRFTELLGRMNFPVQFRPAS
jgi:TolB-like protein/DNA-binding winged helix-turn-helix (wHTH) protein/Tfp pilus assembly protein PilF